MPTLRPDPTFYPSAREAAKAPPEGLAYLARENAPEALEEAADLALYMHLDVLKNFREHGDYEDMALALEAAKFAYEAHRCARKLAAKRRSV